MYSLWFLERLVDIYTGFSTVSNGVTKSISAVAIAYRGWKYKKTYRYVYVFLSTRSCLDNENVDKVRYGPLLKKLTYKIWVRGAFIWRRTVIPRFTWFPAECYKTNDTLMHSIVFQWKIKILVQFLKKLLRVEQSFPVKPGQHTFPSS